MGLILFVLGFVFSIFLSSLIAVPLIGTLVRFRANYTPKGLQLDQEGGAEAHVGPVVTSYFAMLLRVKRIEGWQGLYKGSMPIMLGSAFLTLFATLVMDTSFANPRSPGRYNVPASGILELLEWTLVLTLLTIPFTIITNRAITTPRKLPWLNPLTSFHVLLTPTERARPWKLYTTPGFVVAQVLHILYGVVVLHGVRLLILPSLSDIQPGQEIPQNFTPLRLGIYVICVMISVIVLCPLEVIATRLSLQRNHAGSAPVPTEEPEDGVEFIGQNEDVVGLRSEEDPYLGFVDCYKRIVNEEGVWVLYRAWWLTFLTALSSAFS
ncbi:hypothetical protein SISSUDRAFT_1042814 [Sistotremastrum suecicum HHB10207 ss-3]|uniref:Mitochondrial carrier n=1 Tax=Sistotremastrum suecicum HHB10207 ss-3 TaxID=1314776 RepID=A0A166G9X0_9AGAM|nr:hypothetical protein SISSUDRAFT_1042814 [Sistotremastrum suecicum HHB10207 ss-3]